MNIPLKVLVVDPGSSSPELLKDSLNALVDDVLSVHREASLNDATAYLQKEEVNSIFIDPTGFDLDDATAFIFGVRQRLPAIVFTLFADFQKIESGKLGFYEGKRRRFKHYHKLDKGIPAISFKAELLAAVHKAQHYLAKRMTTDAIEKIESDVVRLQGNTSAGSDKISVRVEDIAEIRDQLKVLTERTHETDPRLVINSVFLSYRFAEKEYIEGLSSLLVSNGFSVVTGQDAVSYVGEAILSRIRDSEFFLCLMTRSEEKADGSFTTSPWLLEEKGAALALGKRIVLMVEEGVSDVGGLQGDWQRIHFSPKGFTVAAIRAVEQLKSYGGANNDRQG